MVNSQKREWDKTFKKLEIKKPEYDYWLDKYKDDVLSASKDIPIIDLGCGSGADTLYLTERGYRVISCDFSGEALKRLKRFVPAALTLEFDMLRGLPFEDGTHKVIIADLSIHYFSWENTIKVIEDIRRVLISDGVLLCRVNSVNDVNYGFGKGIEIEKNYFNINGRLKRFFDGIQLKELFRGWKIINMEEYPMYRYKTKKIVWEIGVKKL